MKTLIYLHGFLSSARSQKALEVAEYIATSNTPVEFICPQLEDHPAQTKIQLSELVLQQDSKPALIGSFLGGFYASWLAEQYDLKAVLVNPAVSPHRLLGENTEGYFNPYTKNRFILAEDDILALQFMEAELRMSATQLMLMVQTGDETLDYRHAVNRYKDAIQIVEAGGDHRFQNFKKHLPEIFRFLQLTEN